MATISEALAIAMLPLIPVSLPRHEPRHVDQYITLTLPTVAEPKPISKAPALPRLLSRLSTPHVLPAPHVASLPVGKPQVQTYSPVASNPAPANAETVRRPLPPPPPAIRTGVFGQPPGNPATAKTSVRQVQTGGFGDPEGLPGQAQGSNQVNVAKLGAFDMAEGPGKGNGAGGPQGRPELVADAGFEVSRTSITEIDTSDMASRVRRAGFDNGAMDGGAARDAGSSAPSGVKTGAFGDAQPTPAAPTRLATAAPEIRPVEILSKPSPQYTAEARRLGVQGEVVLSVIFQADGTLKVVSVIRSLGYGLDQMAEQAASQIKFKPAQQGGKPTNFPALLHIEFRLA